MLYGASRGGAAALNTGLRFGYKCISVDPVVRDGHYEITYDGSHWTKGRVFLQHKAEVFNQDVATSQQWEAPGWGVVSGQGSPLYGDKRSLVEPLALDGRALFLESTDARITAHPEVSARTLRTVTGMMNMAVQGIGIDLGVRESFG